MITISHETVNSIFNITQGSFQTKLVMFLMKVMVTYLKKLSSVSQTFIPKTVCLLIT